MSPAARRRGLSVSALCWSLAPALVSLTITAPAAGAAPGEHRGHFSMDYQYIHIDGFEATTGKLDIGTTDTHSLYFDVAYAITDRWTVSVGIPLVRKRYQGPVPHDPDAIVPPQDQELIDDGDYHTDFQDFHFGASYLAWETPTWSVAPFVGYGVPSNDYPFFGHAAVGQNLWRFDLGAHIAYHPALSYFFATLSPSYVWVEETQGVNIDHWLINGEVGYQFADGVAGKVFAIAKEGNGLDFPDDFPPPRNDAFWFNHDRMVRHNYLNVGVGVDWQINSTHRAHLSWMTMVHADQVHVMEDAITVGWSRSF